MKSYLNIEEIQTWFSQHWAYRRYREKIYLNAATDRANIPTTDESRNRLYGILRHTFSVGLPNDLQNIFSSAFTLQSLCHLNPQILPKYVKEEGARTSTLILLAGNAALMEGRVGLQNHYQQLQLDEDQFPRDLADFLHVNTCYIHLRQSPQRTHYAKERKLNAQVTPVIEQAIREGLKL